MELLKAIYNSNAIWILVIIGWSILFMLTATIVLKFSNYMELLIS